ncbi:hypothetical protein [Cellulomonas fengjieae]|uniref:Rieske domain-containing protein n=1 Tax=Cellulomonas fengjieae TaxID=2819978 RepID=A0ABS3SH60_9CELL|nr:hypothetical protein [Cellulomonas fengjieae]MBO3085072.1 hypothetical protein [Cellulomonas fengjieae]QVI66341.1 hypothetical protein KG102_01615 [Cellulomonas fengjieae]
MTTFEDADFFAETFTEFGYESGARRRSSLLTGLALVAAATLVAGGVVWVRLAQVPADVVAVDPATTLAVFGRPQGPADVVAADDVAGTLIDPASTRLVAQTADARYYAGVSRTHLLCVLTVPAGDLPSTGCAPTDDGVVNLTVDDELMLLSAGEPAPAGWHEAGPNVFLKD